MSDFTVTKTRFCAGVWEGVVAGLTKEKEPKIGVSHLGKPVDFQLEALEDSTTSWALRIPIPTELLADGVQVFLVNDEISGETMTSFSIVAGDFLDDDIRTETELLRAELDMLKRAFRRHCLETT